MRKTLLIILLATTICTACHKNPSKNCPTEERTYTFTNNARVDTVSKLIPGSMYSILTTSVVPGSKRVFTYRRVVTTCPELADGDFTGILVFEAYPNVSHFEYNLDSLAAEKCFYETSCYGCGGAVAPTGGTITGTRTDDNKWYLNVDLAFGSSSPVKFSAHFIPAQ